MKNDIINTEVARIVENNIDTVQAGVFQQKMDRLEKVEVEFVALREDFKSLQITHSGLVEKYERESAKMQRISDMEVGLIRREAEMAQKETQLHIDQQLIELKLENANLRVADHKEMVNTVFRGPVFQKTVLESRSYETQTPANMNDNGSSGYIQTDQHNDTKSTSTTVKED